MYKIYNNTKIYRINFYVIIEDTSNFIGTSQEDLIQKLKEIKPHLAQEKLRIFYELIGRNGCRLTISIDNIKNKWNNYIEV